jgi:ribosomal subunit interface protein
MITLKTTNIEKTDAITDYAEKRLEGLEKFILSKKPINLCAVEIGKTSRRHKKGEFYRAEVRLVAGGRTFYAYSEKEDLYKAIDDVREEIVRELTSNKGRAISMFRHGSRKIKQAIKNLLPFEQD